MNIKIASRIILFSLTLFSLSTFSAPPVRAAEDAPLKVYLKKKLGSYIPGDVIKVSWTPTTTPIQIVELIPVNKKANTIYLHSDLISGDPVITSGSFNYTISDFVVPSGHYYVGVISPGATSTTARSLKSIKVENRPSLYFGTEKGEVNAIALFSEETVTLKWKAESAKTCKASSYPFNSKWNTAVSLTGTKKIRVVTPTTFYLTCKNRLGEITVALHVDTEASVVSTAKLIPSTSFITRNYRLGTTQSEAFSSDQTLTLFNSSAVETIYLRQVIIDQPKWINSGYNTSQIALKPEGVMGTGAFADPSQVSRPGTYTWNLRFEGNFSNSPLIIPITMNVLP